MKTIRIVFVIMLLAAAVHAQSNEPINTREYVENVDVVPELVGGVKELAKHIKYPEAAAKEGIQGTVYVKAYVGETGMIDDVAVEKSPSDLLSQAALDAVRQVRFKPGKQGDKAVKVVVVIPVKFALK